MNATIRIACTFILLLAAGCGGGGGGAAAPAAPTRAVISFSLFSTQRLPFRISGVELSGNLPAGFSVATGGAGQRAIGAGLEGGSTLAAGGAWQTVFGSYSSPKVTILVADGSSAGFGPGEVARLTCQLAPGADTSDNARIAIAGGLAFQASGIDPTALVQPSPLTSYLRSGVSISYLP